MSEQFSDDSYDPAATDRLLDGARTQVTGHGQVGDLLARAAAPGRPEELAGAAAALAAFRAAYPQPVARPRRTLRRAVAFKIGAVAAALTVGGVAFAAHSGVLPNPFPVGPRQPQPSATSGPGGSPSGGASSSPGASPSGAASGSPLPSASAPLASNLHGLCQSFLATADNEKPKATDSPKYAPLRAAAGEQDLTEYCTALVAAGNSRPTANPGNGPSPQPSPSLNQGPTADRSHPAPATKKSKPV